MELLIHGKSVEVNDVLREYVQKKMTAVGRLLPGATQATVELTREPTKSQEDQVVAEVTVNCNGTLLRAERRASTVQAALNAVVPAVRRQVDQFKGRRSMIEKAKKAGKVPALRQFGADELLQETEGTAETVQPESPVARVKRFPIKPMSPEEAIHQMELLGHTFFLFFNFTDNQFNVAYRRRDKTYGLIQPELK